MHYRRYFPRSTLLLGALVAPALAQTIPTPPSAGNGPATVITPGGNEFPGAVGSPFATGATINDALFAAELARHHQVGIALLDLAVSRSGSQEVIGLAQEIRDDNAQELARLEQASNSQGLFQNDTQDLFAESSSLAATDPSNLAAFFNLQQPNSQAGDEQVLVALLAHHSSAIDLAYRRLALLTSEELQELAREAARESAEEVGRLEQLRRQQTGGTSDAAGTDGQVETPADTGMTGAEATTSASEQETAGAGVIQDDGSVAAAGGTSTM